MLGIYSPYNATAQKQDIEQSYAILYDLHAPPAIIALDTTLVYKPSAPEVHRCYDGIGLSDDERENENEDDKEDNSLHGVASLSYFTSLLSSIADCHSCTNSSLTENNQHINLSSVGRRIRFCVFRI